ncbi:hypothetical protein F5B20DRAFT_593116 [Whalleya microplaca]|nr:hypothetical protein F5B20DRAFT_593116 [Whalleya microplaca]
MGMVMTVLRKAKALLTHLPSTPLSKPPNPPPIPPLLDLPPCVLLEISHHLPPENAAALALTCRASYALLHPQLKTDLHSTSLLALLALLALLERDLGDRQSAQQTQAPAPPSPSIPLIADYGAPYVTFHHARLVLNRRLWGGKAGLPLSQLEDTGWRDQRGEGWRVQSEAAVLEGEGNELLLLLRAEHTLRLDSQGDDREPARRGAARARAPGYYDEEPGTERVPQLEKGEDGGVAPCRLAPGHCAVCLTDYTATVEQRVGQWGKRTYPCWFVTIVSYHQLGDCRDPRDWKWQCFASRRPGGGGMSRARGFSRGFILLGR